MPDDRHLQFLEAEDCSTSLSDVSVSVAELVRRIDASFARLKRAASNGEILQDLSFEVFDIRVSLQRLGSATSRAPGDDAAKIDLYFRLVEIVGAEHEDLQIFGRNLLPPTASCLRARGRN